MITIKRCLLFACRYLSAGLLCLFIFTVGVVCKRSRNAISAILEAFGISTAPVRHVIPEIPVSAIVPEQGPIRILEPISKSGNISPLELIVLIKLIEKRKPLRLFEIGTFDGRTALNMAAASPDGAKVFTLDLPGQAARSTTLPLAEADKFYILKENSGSRFKGTEFEPKITQLFGDSAVFDFGPYENSMDFIFVDGSHSHEYVLKDSGTALKLLRNGKGIILWHDYLGKWYGAAQALNELYRTKEFGGARNIQGTSLVCLIRE